MVDISRTILNAHNYYGALMNRRREEFIDYEVTRAAPRWKNLPYLFVRRNPIRHCKVSEGYGGFLDYTVRPIKSFPTIEAWVEDCGATLEEVRYGYESELPQYKSFSLSEIIEPVEKIMKPVEEVAPVDPFLQLEERMQTLGLNFANVAVVNNNRVTMATDFMEGL